MTGREKLIALTMCHCSIITSDACPKSNNGKCTILDCATCLADHLIANGVVPVVLCKDCEHRTDKMYIGHYMCKRKMDGMVDPYDFCSYGERRSDD